MTESVSRIEPAALKSYLRLDPVAVFVRAFQGGQGRFSNDKRKAALALLKEMNDG